MRDATGPAEAGRRRASPSRLAAALILLAVAPARAEDAGSGEPVDTPLPPSLEVRVPGAYVQTSPSERGSRRGTLALGSRLRPLESRSATGCARPWYRIGDEAWVCGESLARRGSAPSAPQLPVVEEGQLVPLRYGFARDDGARLYRTLEDIDLDEWEQEFEPSSGLHIAGEVARNGHQYHRLADGGYVAAGDVRPARPSSFAGLTLGPGQLAAFVTGRAAEVRSGPGKGRVLRRLDRRTGVPVLETVLAGRAQWVRIGPAEWVAGRGLAVVEPVPPPPPVGPSERWVHVDRERQILTAYEGARPVFATLISTGRHGAATPAGIFRIWAKLATATMDDQSDSMDERPYSMQGVPWVMYFNEGVALHAAYWHDDFGRRRSHGCVNLAPADAAFLFSWTAPSLPPGWTSVLPTRSDQGTIVVVQ
jgi:hypothetical protein